MYASEATAFSAEHGCAAHGRSDCLCDVQLLDGGVPVREVPFADRLLELGVTRQSFLRWAEEIAAWHDSQALHVCAEA